MDDDRFESVRSAKSSVWEYFPKKEKGNLSGRKGHTRTGHRDLLRVERTKTIVISTTFLLFFSPLRILLTVAFSMSGWVGMRCCIMMQGFAFDLLHPHDRCDALRAKS